MESASKKRPIGNDDQRGESVAGGDCATCKRRRIKCDRSLDACQKCKKKDLICPGYNTRVQWVNDVATRGHLKGLQAAFLESQSRLRSQRASLNPSTTDTGDARDFYPGTGTREESEGEGSASKLPFDIPPTDLDMLKIYYRDHIARLMVWIDSEDNPYQTQVLPMVSTSPVLLQAISAISELHWNATRQADQLVLTEDLRGEAVLSITASVRAIIHSTTHIDLETAQWMLASMMVLSCCEMIEVGATAADWHRRAARALINVIKTTAWRDDELLVFLMNQLADYDILSCTTSFDLADVQAAILPTSRGNRPLFSRLLCLVHEITLESRRNLVSPEERKESSYQTLLQLRYEVEMARGETLMAAGSASFRNQAQKRDFVRLVDLYCKATLIYARRACHDWKAAPNHGLVDDFFCILETLEQSERLYQNLAWPLFIAGTEIRQKPQKQAKVINIFGEIRSVTGFDHFRELVEFLRALWSGSSDDWLSSAKEWEQRGKRILAV